MKTISTNNSTQSKNNGEIETNFNLGFKELD